MARKSDLMPWIVEALTRAGGEAPLVSVAEFIWLEHEDELRKSGDLFYTWQYDMRWAALKLRKDGTLRPAEDSEAGWWALAARRRHT
jgi:hypothetical protein